MNSDPSFLTNTVVHRCMLITAALGVETGRSPEPNHAMMSPFRFQFIPGLVSPLTCKSSTWKGEAGGSGFEASLVYV